VNPCVYATIARLKLLREIALSQPSICPKAPRLKPLQHVASANPFRGGRSVNRCARLGSVTGKRLAVLFIARFGMAALHRIPIRTPYPNPLTPLNSLTSFFNET
jgi:hypothetical protein